MYVSGPLAKRNGTITTLQLLLDVTKSTLQNVLCQLLIEPPCLCLSAADYFLWNRTLIPRDATSSGQRAKEA